MIVIVIINSIFKKKGKVTRVSSQLLTPARKHLLWRPQRPSTLRTEQPRPKISRQPSEISWIRKKLDKAILYRWFSKASCITRAKTGSHSCSNLLKKRRALLVETHKSMAFWKKKNAKLGLGGPQVLFFGVYLFCIEGIKTCYWLNSPKRTKLYRRPDHAESQGNLTAISTLFWGSKATSGTFVMIVATCCQPIVFFFEGFLGVLGQGYRDFRPIWMIGKFAKQNSNDWAGLPPSSCSHCCRQWLISAPDGRLSRQETKKTSQKTRMYPENQFGSNPSKHKQRSPTH